MLKRQDTRWFRSIQGPKDEIVLSTPGRAQAASLLEFAQQANLLVDNNGNVSCRVQGGADYQGGFLITPRGVDKSTLTECDLMFVRADLSTRTITYTGERQDRKSSIDSVVSAILYQTFPKVDALLHFHAGAGLVLPDGRTKFPFPCGTVEEAEEVLNAVHRGGNKKAVSSFMIELVDHGYMLALPTGGITALRQSWTALTDKYKEHLASMGTDIVSSGLKLYPIFSGPEIVGLIARHPNQESSLFLDPAKRGQGKGEALISLLERIVN